MRIGAVLVAGLATLGASASTHANPHLELGGFFGAEDFGEKVGLGDSAYAEQRPQAAPLLGVRATAWLLTFRSFELGIEPEVSFAPSWTRYGFDGARASSFAPVLGYSGALILRIRQPWFFQPHILVGGGGASVFSTSRYLSDDTDPVLFFGVGATIPMGAMGNGWHLRLDARESAMKSSDGGTNAAYQGTVAVGYRFGAHHHRVRVAPPVPEPVTRPPPEPVVIAPPPPPPDADGDGIVGDADKCPDQAEDFDHFEDEDGCPDPDNDHDGIADAVDKCPNEPETVNGFDDEDGCPDTVPPVVSAAFAAASAVKFEPSRARLTEAGKTSLGRALAQLHAHPTMHVVVTAHPEKRADGKVDAAKGDALAKKRAEVVKWYLVEQGIPADQLETAVGDVKKAPIELATAPPSAH